MKTPLILLVAGIAIGFGLGRMAHRSPQSAAEIASTPVADAPAAGEAGKPQAPKSRTAQSISETSPGTSTAANGGEISEAERVEPPPPTEPFAALKDSAPPPIPDFTDLPPKIAQKLNGKRRPNLNRTIASSLPVSAMDGQIKGLLGKFEGDILIDEETGKTWQISLETDGKIAKDQFVGKSVARLSRNGRIFSANSHNGQLKNIRSVADGKTSFLVEVSDIYYLEAFYDAPTDSLYGNFYGKNSKGGWGYRGYATLTRP